MQNSLQLLRIRDVMERTRISRSYIYRLIQQDEFPKPLKISVRGRRWRLDEIQEWIEARTAERDHER